MSENPTDDARDALHASAAELLEERRAGAALEGVRNEALDVKRDGRAHFPRPEDAFAASARADLLNERWPDGVPGTAQRAAMAYEERQKAAKDDEHKADPAKDDSAVTPASLRLAGAAEDRVRLAEDTAEAMDAADVPVHDPASGYVDTMREHLEQAERTGASSGYVDTMRERIEAAAAGDTRDADGDLRQPGPADAEPATGHLGTSEGTFAHGSGSDLATSPPVEAEPASATEGEAAPE